MVQAAGGFDLVTCLYDSLNHLTDPVDLRRALVGARRLLAPGGLFFFDVNTPHAYRSVWGDSHDSYLGAHHARFWRSRYDQESGLATLDATYFVPVGDLWRRVQFLHTARGYDDAFIRASLAEAGFTLHEAYEALSFTPVSGETYRAAYLAGA
jgi:SAM-dependent methyltransferase